MSVFLALHQVSWFHCRISY